MGIQISRKILNLIRKKSIETDLERIDIIEFVDKHVKPSIINICMHSAYRLRHKNNKKLLKDLTKGPYEISENEKCLK